MCNIGLVTASLFSSALIFAGIYSSYLGVRNKESIIGDNSQGVAIGIGVFLIFAGIVIIISSFEGGTLSGCFCSR